VHLRALTHIRWSDDREVPRFCRRGQLGGSTECSNSCNADIGSG
jgi:hypothetical protein